MNDDKVQREKHPGTWQQDFFSELKMLVGVLVTVVLIFHFAAQLIVVVGSSMKATLHDSDLLLAIRLDRSYSVGDVVIIHKETPVIQETIVKRVIATGGQKVEIDYDTNSVYVDGVELDEPYINRTELEPEDEGDPMQERGDVVSITVPEGSVFVMGDNRNHSTDSRFLYQLGLIDERYITAKAVLCFFPFNHMKLLF